MESFQLQIDSIELVFYSFLVFRYTESRVKYIDSDIFRKTLSILTSKPNSIKLFGVQPPAALRYDIMSLRAAAVRNHSPPPQKKTN